MIKNGVYGFYFARCMDIIFNSLLAQLVKYDVHTTRKIKSIHAIFSKRELSVCLSVCRLSVTFMHPTQPIKIFGNVSTPFNTLVT